MAYRPYELYATDDPKMINFKPVAGVMMRFDLLGMQQFAKFTSECSREYAELQRMSHEHFRDSLYWPYWLKQQEQLSRDVIIAPVINAGAGNTQMSVTND